MTPHWGHTPTEQNWYVLFKSDSIESHDERLAPTYSILKEYNIQNEKNRNENINIVHWVFPLSFTLHELLES